MFEWLKRDTKMAPGVKAMMLEFGQMLDAGRQMFVTAANAVLGGTDPAVIRSDLFATDGRINLAEQHIRREIVVHATVHGTTHLSALLILMSIVKDAERIGDYAKNLFDLAVQAPPLERDRFHADLVQLKDRIAEGLAATRRVFDGQLPDEARALTREWNGLEDCCDARVQELLLHQRELVAPATLVLAYRYFKRVASHAMNVTTSIFMPLDKIDFFDEKPRPPKP